MLDSPLPAFHELTTERLVLRAPRATDAEAALVMRSDPEVMRHVNRPMATTLEEAQAWLELISARTAANESVHWAITRKGEDRFMGLIGLWRLVKEHHYGELGYTVMREHWGRGYTSEAIGAVVDFGFRTLGLHRVEAITRPQNAASMRVLEKNGFVREGLMRGNILWNGVFQDSVYFGRLAP